MATLCTPCFLDHLGCGCLFPKISKMVGLPLIKNLEVVFYLHNNNRLFRQLARTHWHDQDRPSNYRFPLYNHQYTTAGHTHHALIVCGALRRVCPCDDDRDAKEDDSDGVSVMSDKFSRKQLRNATKLVLRRQKPSTNALDGLYLPCVDRMLDDRWVELC